MRRKKVIILFILLFFCNGLFSSPTRIKTLIDDFRNHPEHILVTAHRAAHQKYPENSIAAINEAIRIGADIVETDVRETKDHKLVIMHDESIDRTTNGTGLVKDLTLSELKEKRLVFNGKVTDQKILTFREVLDAIKGEILVNVDFKADGQDAINTAYRQIKEKGVEDQILFYVYNHYNLIPVLQKLDPEITIMTRAYSEEDVDKILSFPDMKIMQIDFSFYNDKWAENVIQKGIRISGNALGEYDKMQQESGTGYDEITKKHINIIETDYPEELLSYLRGKNLHR